MHRLRLAVAALLAGCSLFPETPPIVDASASGGGTAGSTGGRAGSSGAAGTDGGGSAGVVEDGGIDGSGGCGSKTLSIEAAADTYLADIPPNDVHGSEAIMRIRCYAASSGFRGLIRFPITDVPEKATVTSAVVRLVLVKNDGGTHQLGLHRVLHSWTEAGASWNHYDGSLAWTTSGGDFDALPAASQDVTETVAVGTTLEWDVTAEISAFMSGDPNDGWIIKEDLPPFTGNELDFATREAVATTTRPKLDVTYSVCL